MVCNDIPCDIPERDPPRTYVLCEKRSSIQSLVLMRSAITHAKFRADPYADCIPIHIDYSIFWAMLPLKMAVCNMCTQFHDINARPIHWKEEVYCTHRA